MTDDGIRLALSIGLPCFPCRENKAPACPHGFKSAESDPHKIKELWRRYPGPLVGVPTGLISGLAVIDVDPIGMPWFQAQMLRRRLPETRMHQTRRGGYHLLYKCPDPPIRNSAGKLAPGVDTRGEGGFIIWWPVVHEVDPTEFPKWVLRRLSAKRKQTDIPFDNSDRARDLSPLIRFITASRPGDRNCRVFWAACRAGELVRRGDVTRSSAVSEISEAARSIGLDATEAERTALSGINLVRAT